MAFDADGLLHVVDSGNKQVDVFAVDDVARTLRFVRSYGAPYRQGGEASGAVIRGDMRGLAIDRDHGWVYVVDGEGNRVHKFTTAGDHLLTWGGAATFSDGGREATVDHAGNVWVGDMPGYRVQVFSPTGERLFVHPDPPQPPPPGGFNGPRGVAVDPRTGDLFVSDTYNFRIQKLSSDGTPITQWGSRGRSEPRVDRPPHFWLVDSRQTPAIRIAATPPFVVAVAHVVAREGDVAIPPRAVAARIGRAEERDHWDADGCRDVRRPGVARQHQNRFS